MAVEEELHKASSSPLDKLRPTTPSFDLTSPAVEVAVHLEALAVASSTSSARR